MMSFLCDVLFVIHISVFGIQGVVRICLWFTDTLTFGHTFVPNYTFGFNCEFSLVQAQSDSYKQLCLFRIYHPSMHRFVKQK